MAAPENWISETNDHGLTSLYNATDGFGAIQISVYTIPDGLFIDSVQELKSHLDEIYKSVDIATPYFNIVDEGGIYWRYWLFNFSNEVVFITYNCEEPERGKEDIVVDSIIKSIEASHFR
ncbi:hypothetical protein [Mucilaginibacter sp. UYCu711]|uniref:hypothetical protein n=1 Tax=Mucilaginibacter sp. UYCu711 TaxID=3156339 RepID=UPI003D255932